MKNQYFGDVNDYRKYGLLRILSSCGQFRIGICWMLTTDDGRTDGQLIRYLDEPKKWRQYDPQLFDCLRKLVKEEKVRNVQMLQTEQLVPSAKFYAESLSDTILQRQSYFKKMYQLFLDTDLIFFDPDNGVEVKSKKMGQNGSSKYIYWNELKYAFETGQSILVYQHFRREERKKFIEQMIAEYQSRTGVSVVHWFRTPQVIYFLLLQPKHIERVHISLEEVEKKWSIDNQILVG
ncbi:MAG: hypothetical protein ABI638_03290 [Ignavibacteriota bacterium]